MNKNVLLSTEIIKLKSDADISGGCVVAVGNFDGVHLGHRALLSALKNEAERLNLPAAVFTFDPYDSPRQDIKLLALPEKKLSLLRDSGVDLAAVAPFSLIKNMSASDFAKELLFKHLKAKSIICGYDFRFGKGREGDSSLIKRLLSPKGVSVINPKAESCLGEPISSTAIRALIASGDIAEANRRLGYRFSFSGEVIGGARLGRTLGFPTINMIYPERLETLKFGVYAVRCRISGTVYDGIANIGIKPTVGNTDMPLCETHLFDYSGDCYGETAEIEFIEFIREEQRFASVSELKKQIERDIAHALK